MGVTVYVYDEPLIVDPILFSGSCFLSSFFSFFSSPLDLGGCSLFRAVGDCVPFPSPPSRGILQRLYQLYYAFQPAPYCGLSSLLLIFYHHFREVEGPCSVLYHLHVLGDLGKVF